MEKILTPKDIAARYSCSIDTARRYIRRMDHLERPLGVYESSLLRWEMSRSTGPGSTNTHKTKTGISKPLKNKYFVSRVR